MGLKRHLSVSTLLLLSLLVLASASGYGSPPMYEAPSDNSLYGYTNYFTGDVVLPPIIGVEGLIYCASCYDDYTPIEGGVAKIYCEAKNGYESAKFSLLTPKTDKNGYFLATFTPEQLGDHLNPTDCKVYLESSPLHTCNVATNINQGIKGADLIYNRDIANYENKYTLELYSVPGFAYTTTTKCVKPNYEAPAYPPSAYAPKSVYAP